MDNETPLGPHERTGKLGKGFYSDEELDTMSIELLPDGTIVRVDNPHTPPEDGGADESFVAPRKE